MACGTEEFFEYVPEVWDEGRALLPLGLTADQQAAYDALHAELDALAARLVYDASGWPAPKNVVPQCDGDTADTGTP